MKILTDFDGTLTEIYSEYEVLLEIIKSRLEEKHFPVDRYQTLFDLAIKEIQKDYISYGWSDHGRITAYSDEDLFMNIIAGIRMVDKWLHTKPEYSELLDILASQNTNLMDISEYAYSVLHTKPLRPMNTPFLDAMKTIQTLLVRGHEVVVVSNSPSARIVQKLNYVGLIASVHEMNPKAQLRVRGDAAKFKLGEQPQIIDFIRPVDINRPVYRQILVEEKPDIVVGDVFSLDLALPCGMAMELPDFSQTRSLLIAHSYTPEWAKRAIQSAPNGLLIESITEILEDL